MKSWSFGEVLWDLIDGREYIGGAPFNVAAHLARLGDLGSILTRIGVDPRGTAALEEMRRMGVDASSVQIDPMHPTGWARVELDAAGAPSFRFAEEPAYDFIAYDDAWGVAGAAADAVCFGTLVQRGEGSRESLHRLLAAVSFRHVFFDVNIRRDFCPEEVLRRSLAAATIVKLNAGEVGRIAAALYGGAMGEAELAARIAGDFGAATVCITKGGEGCTIHGHGAPRDVPAERVEVVDTVGAGDAFSAAFLHHFVRTGDPFESARRGNLLGAYVASRAGAVPDYTEEIRRALAD